MDTRTTELMPEELERANSGMFTPNLCRMSAYDDTGAKVIAHYLVKGEFLCRGENIVEKYADSVMFFAAMNGHAPGSPEESLFLKKHHREPRTRRHR